MPTELLKGTLDLLILRTLTLQASHGLEIARRIEQMTRGTFDVKPGSLFPALHRLVARGWVTSSWSEPGVGRRAKYYQLTKAGLRQVETETANWRKVVEAMTRAIDATS